MPQPLCVVVYEPNIADLRVKRAIRVNNTLLIFSDVRQAIFHEFSHAADVINRLDSVLR